MELNYSDLKKKKVVNVIDGRDLGKVSDLVLSYPDGRVIAFLVGKKSIFKDDLLIVNLTCVNKIGDDAILVSLREAGVECPVCTDETQE